MITELTAKQLAERVLSLVRTHKGAEARVTVSDGTEGHTRFARNTITSSADVERTAIALTVQFGQRSATASTNQLDEHAIADVVDRAARLAKLAPENPETLPPLGAQTYPRSSGVDPATAKLGAKQRATAVATALAEGAQLDLAGFYTHTTTLTAHASTLGLWAAHEATNCEVSCTARTADGTGSGWAGARSHKSSDIDAATLMKIAVDKATRSQKPKRLDPGRYTVVLEPAATGGLLTYVIGALNARRADEGRSAFAKPGGGTRLGEKLFADGITLRSDPNDAATGGSPFDSEGMPTPAATWIENGKLAAFTYSRFWAKQQKKTATGSPSGWSFDAGKVDLAGMLKGIKRGVLITRFWYMRDLDPQVLAVTGLTRDGTFLIEDGAVTTPVNNFRFNDSPLHVLAKCDALGAAHVAAYESVRAPLLRTHEFNLASISEAV